MKFESLRLKICEGCGRLWFRVEAVKEVYCSGCDEKLAHYPQVSAEGRSGRKRAVSLVAHGGAR